MLPAIKGISNDPAYKDNDIRKKFQHAEEVITKAAEKKVQLLDMKMVQELLEC